MGADERSLLVNFVSLDSTKFLQMICRIFHGDVAEHRVVLLLEKNADAIKSILAIGHFLLLLLFVLAYEGMPAP